MESIPQGKSAGRMFGTNCPSQDVWQGELVRIAKLSEGDLVAVGTASLNLFCGAVLPGTEGLDRIKLYAILAAWEDYIQRNTEHWWSDFLKNPHDGVETPGKFRMAAMATLLQRQLGVRYNLSFTEGDYDGRDSRNLFLHGPLSGFGGTCVTLPVLYLSIGRRLGYPLWLVKTKEHFFVRWEESGGERFNVECACRGFLSWSDEEYRTWRTPITAAEVQSGAFLRNLTRREELAQFLNERGNCLLDHLRMSEALEAYCHAQQLAPHDNGIRGNRVVASMIQRTLKHTKGSATYWGGEMVDVQGLRYPQPQDAQEAWAMPHVKNTLVRIMRLRGSYSGGPQT